MHVYNLVYTLDVALVFAFGFSFRGSYWLLKLGVGFMFTCLLKIRNIQLVRLAQLVSVSVFQSFIVYVRGFESHQNHLNCNLTPARTRIESSIVLKFQMWCAHAIRLSVFNFLFFQIRLSTSGATSFRKMLQ